MSTAIASSRNKLFCHNRTSFSTSIVYWTYNLFTITQFKYCPIRICTHIFMIFLLLSYKINFLIHPEFEEHLYRSIGSSDLTARNIISAILYHNSNFISYVIIDMNHKSYLFRIIHIISLKSNSNQLQIFYTIKFSIRFLIQALFITLDFSYYSFSVNMSNGKSIHVHCCTLRWICIWNFESFNNNNSQHPRSFS